MHYRESEEDIEVKKDVHAIWINNIKKDNS